MVIADARAKSQRAIVTIIHRIPKRIVHQEDIADNSSNDNYQVQNRSVVFTRLKKNKLNVNMRMKVSNCLLWSQNNQAWYTTEAS